MKKTAPIKIAYVEFSQGDKAHIEDPDDSNRTLCGLKLSRLDTRCGMSERDTCATCARVQRQRTFAARADEAKLPQNSPFPPDAGTPKKDEKPYPTTRHTVPKSLSLSQIKERGQKLFMDAIDRYHRVGKLHRFDTETEKHGLFVELVRRLTQCDAEWRKNEMRREEVNVAGLNFIAWFDEKSDEVTMPTVAYQTLIDAYETQRAVDKFVSPSSDPSAILPRFDQYRRQLVNVVRSQAHNATEIEKRIAPTMAAMRTLLGLLLAERVASQNTTPAEALGEDESEVVEHRVDTPEIGFVAYERNGLVEMTLQQFRDVMASWHNYIRDAKLFRRTVEKLTGE